MTKALKLLELAARTSTPEAERLAALNAFARVADKVGGIERLFVGVQHEEPLGKMMHDQRMELQRRNMKLSAEVGRLKRMLEVAKEQLLLFQIHNPLERDREMRAKSLIPESALYGTLDREWRTVRQIYVDCQSVGFNGVENTIRNRLAKLAAKGCIEGRVIDFVAHYRLAQ